MPWLGRNSGEFRPGSNFLAWICRIARFRVLSYFDAKRRRPLSFSDAFLDAVEEDLAAMSDTLDGEMFALADCYHKLRPDDRELIDRRYVPGANTLQIAAAVGRPLSTVYRSAHSHSSRIVGLHRRGDARSRLKMDAKNVSIDELERLLWQMRDGQLDADGRAHRSISNGRCRDSPLLHPL